LETHSTFAKQPLPGITGASTCIARCDTSTQAVRTYEPLYATYKRCYPALKVTMHDLHDQQAALRNPAPDPEARREPSRAIQRTRSVQ
jgi:hypothetical protein